MTETLKGRGAVVTGGGRGIGAAIAATLAEAGAKVVVTARTEGQIAAVAEQIQARGHAAFAVPCDVADPVQVASLAEAASGHLGTVDILVNNAGIAFSSPLPELEFEEWNRAIAVNATGPFLCTKAFLPGMAERNWGRIFTIASVSGLAAGKYIAAYAASKHAAVGFVRSVAAELAGTGVSIHAICPAYVDTEITRDSIRRVMEKTHKSKEEALAAILDTIDQDRIIDPREIGEVVLELCLAHKPSKGDPIVVLDGKS